MANPTGGFSGYIKIGLTAAPTNKMSGINDISLPFTTTMLDVSNMDTGATQGYTQVIPGLTGAKGTVKLNHDPSDTNGQLVARAASISKALVYLIVSENNVNTATFSCYIDSYVIHGGVAVKTDATITFTMTGAVVLA
jgi:hypothetical protein